MSSGKKIKIIENQNDENLPFDIYDSDYPPTVTRSENNRSSLMDSKSTARVASSTSPSGALNDYDVDDEEDFISKYNIIRGYNYVKTKPCSQTYLY